MLLFRDQPLVEKFAGHDQSVGQRRRVLPDIMTGEEMRRTERIKGVPSARDRIVGVRRSGSAAGVRRKSRAAHSACNRRWVRCLCLPAAASVSRMGFGREKTANQGEVAEMRRGRSGGMRCAFPPCDATEAQINEVIGGEQGEGATTGGARARRTVLGKSTDFELSQQWRPFHSSFSPSICYS